MKKIILIIIMTAALSASAYADFGSMLNAVKNNPLMAQQSSLNDLIAKIKNISAVFSMMPNTGGKMDFLKAALPLMAKADAVGQSKPTDVAQIGGLLDQVKGLIAQKWSANALTAAQAPQATQQSQQFSGFLSSLLKNEGAALKNLMAPAAK